MIENVIYIQSSQEVDYISSAKLAVVSFGDKKTTFSEDYLKWLYKNAFGCDATIVEAFSGERKVGQAAILWHEIKIGKRVSNCAQLVDLFVDPEHRSFGIVRKLYDGLRQCLNERDGVAIITVPNPKATPFNKRFLKLQPSTELNIKFGAVHPLFNRRGARSIAVNKYNKERVISLLEKHVLSDNGDCIPWTPEKLWNRLQRPEGRYTLQFGFGVCIITSARTFRNVPCFLICGIFRETGVVPNKQAITALLKESSRVHRRYLYVYVGINDMIPKPGFELPAAFRPSPMQVYVNVNVADIRFSRFEGIDFDFA